jgi:hypothetical protein
VLVRLPAALAARAAARLTAQGIPARIAGRGGSWRLVPASLYFVAAAAAGAGIWAGVLGSPALGVASPWVAGAVLLMGCHAVGRPALERLGPPDRLPPGLADLVSSQLRLLPAGEARTLLSDVIRLGCELCRAAPSFEEQAAEIVRAACAAAPALARVEDALSRIAARRPAPDSEAPARLESARAALMQHLLDAIAALGDALSRAAEPDPDTLSRLASASRDLHDELAHRTSAAAEVEALLSPGLPLVPGPPGRGSG